MKGLILSILIAVSLGAIGCAQKNDPVDIPQNQVNLPPGTWLPPRNDGTIYNPPTGSTYNWNEGATVDLTISDANTFALFTGRPMNFPAGPIVIKMNMNYREILNGGFAGEIRFGYEEKDYYGNIIYREPTFKSAYDASYSGYFNIAGKQVFKSFLQDLYGAILIVIDSQDDLGSMSGKIYFNNFRSSTNVQGPLKNPGCWLIQIGPYDCRDFLVGSGSDNKKTLDMNSSIYPNRIVDGKQFYQLLGTFGQMNKQKALNL